MNALNWVFEELEARKEKKTPNKGLVWPQNYIYTLHHSTISPASLRAIINNTVRTRETDTVMFHNAGPRILLSRIL